MSRRRGSGSLYRQPGQKVWTLQYYQDGRQRKESSRTEDRAEAQRLLNKRLYQIDQGETITTTRVRCQQLFEDLIKDTEARGKNPYDHRKHWRHLGPRFAGRFAASVTSSDIAEYRVMRREAQPSTINRELATLRRVFNLATEQTPPKLTTVPHFTMGKEDNVRTGFLDPSDYDAVVAAATETWLRAIFEIAYRYGWRKGELPMRVRQADFEANVLRLDRSKNGEGREVTMTPTIRLLLAACARGKGPDDFLFTRADGKPVLDFRVAWRKLTAAAGVPDLMLHDLRRTAVRNMVRAGTPEKVAMTITGHKTRSVFERYNVISQADIKQAVARMENDPRFDPYSPEMGPKAESEKLSKPQ